LAAPALADDVLGLSGATVSWSTLLLTAKPYLKRIDRTSADSWISKGSALASSDPATKSIFDGTKTDVVVAKVPQPRIQIPSMRVSAVSAFDDDNEDLDSREEADQLSMLSASPLAKQSQGGGGGGDATTGRVSWADVSAKPVKGALANVEGRGQGSVQLADHIGSDDVSKEAKRNPREESEERLPAVKKSTWSEAAPATNRDGLSNARLTGADASGGADAVMTVSAFDSDGSDIDESGAALASKMSSQLAVPARKPSSTPPAVDAIEATATIRTAGAAMDSSTAASIVSSMPSTTGGDTAIGKIASAQTQAATESPPKECAPKQEEVATIDSSILVSATDAPLAAPDTAGSGTQVISALSSSSAVGDSTEVMIAAPRSSSGIGTGLLEGVSRSRYHSDLMDPSLKELFTSTETTDSRPPLQHPTMASSMSWSVGSQAKTQSEDGKSNEASTERKPVAARGSGLVLAPLSEYAQLSGIIIEGWLEKKSGRTGLWLKVRETE
jgi:hypothetical protein